MRPDMFALRALVCNHRPLAVLLIVLALCIKGLVPAGTMIAATSRVLTVEICADASRAGMTRDIVVPMRPDGDGQSADHAAKGTPCDWSALGFGALPAVDPIVLAIALAFIALAGFHPCPSHRALRTARLRPPLRAPPAFA